MDICPWIWAWAFKQGHLVNRTDLDLSHKAHQAVRRRMENPKSSSEESPIFSSNDFLLCLCLNKENNVGETLFLKNIYFLKIKRYLAKNLKNTFFVIDERFNFTRGKGIFSTPRKKTFSLYLLKKLVKRKITFVLKEYIQTAKMYFTTPSFSKTKQNHIEINFLR